MELLTVFILVAVLPHSALSTPESDALLDSMLEADGIVLTPAALTIRREIFEFVYLTQEAGEKLSLEDMYTEEEREKQNGAVPAARELLLVNEELQKRAESVLETVSAPRTFDARKLTIPGTGESLVNPVQNQQTCGNCYLHTFIAALEIAYAKATANRVKFSEQEMTDCYFKGCNGGDFRMVSILMSYIDKLSSRKDYGEYLDGKFTCRQPTTPDSLEGIKITGYVAVTPKTAAAAISHYGSVMTCMAWGSGPGQKCRMDNYDGVSVVRGTPVGEGEQGACAHAVLIVGYTEDYYIVRNSHGHSWGDDGYFYIERNTNSCGIETTMAAISVESRPNRKPLAPNKCPTDKPKFCSEISTCVEKGQECIQVPSAMEKRDAMRYARSLGEEEELEDKPLGWGLPGMQQQMLEKRQQCTDKMGPRCPSAVKQFGCDTQNMDVFCALSCNKCKTSPVIVVPPSSGEKTGDCFRPAIANGVATNKPIMRYKEKLQVRCNAGYNLVGEPVYCLIQNVFTNKDKDARLMPECIKLGSDVLVGNGAGYTGSQNKYKDAFGRTKICDSWNKDVLEGQLMNKLDGYKYKLGNHNFCRNPTGTEPVPMCLGFNEYSKIAEPVYCFEHPNCSVCRGASDSSDNQVCQTGKNNGLCKYTDSTTVASVNYYWKQCTKTCCSDQC